MTAERHARLLADKAMLRQTLEDSGLTLKEVAAAMNLPYAYVAHMLNDEKSQPPTWDCVRLFMQATDRRRPICSLASEFGAAVIALPTAVPGTDDIRAEFMDAMGEVGQSSEAINRALADWKISADEGRDIVSKLRRASVALLETEAAVLAKVEKPVAARMDLPASSSAARRRA